MGQNNKTKLYIIFKRLCDFSFAVILFFLLLPVIIFASIWVKMDSKGPILFKQKRLGKNQCVFTIYKFRTMKIETEKDGRPLLDKQRVTLSGKILRKTSIDELPQLLNIIKGEMSFIGPRPFPTIDMDTYSSEQMIRFEVLPGITSWTAIHGRNTLTIQEKYNYEIAYVKNIGLKRDLEIFFKTIILVISCKDVEDRVNPPRIGADLLDDDPKNTEN